MLWSVKYSVTFFLYPIHNISKGACVCNMIQQHVKTITGSVQQQISEGPNHTMLANHKLFVFI